MTLMQQEALSRRQERERLLELRRNVPSTLRVEMERRLLTHLDEAMRSMPCHTLGLYWPIKREIDLRNWAARLSASRSIALALPVVVAPHQPLQYVRWSFGAPMERGFWNIPVPRDAVVAEPDIVIAPLVGVFGQYRLGYGGGYFDRTLAHLTPRPVAIGIGFELCRLAHFTPQPHDIPMDVVVTECAISRF